MNINLKAYAEKLKHFFVEQCLTWNVYVVVLVKGVATRESAGHVANIAESASKLNPSMPNPVISIEGEGG